jgi:hypothetical protein
MYIQVRNIPFILPHKLCFKKQVGAPTVPSAVIRGYNELEDFRCHTGVTVSHSLFTNWYIYVFFCIFGTFLCYSVTLCLSVTRHWCHNGRVSDKLSRLPRHQRAQAHNSTHTISTSVLCTGYVVNKTVSCVLMKMILVAII